MIWQLFLGTCIILATILLAAAVFWDAEVALSRAGPWIIRKPHAPKMALVLVLAVLGVLVLFTCFVWLWAIALIWIGVFSALETAVYFSIVAFTTLGFGDVLLPVEWRILGGLAAANGLLNLGLLTAMLVEMLRRVRTIQTTGRPDEH